jgi:hypothetical protein
MKTFILLAVSIVLVSIFSCPLAMAAPPMPDDLQMVQPDPSLPKEIADFWGKWEGSDPYMKLFLIVEKIDEEKASLYVWRSGFQSVQPGWERIEAKVYKEYGKYKLWFRKGGSNREVTLRGKYLYWETGGGNGILSRVP